MKSLLERDQKRRKLFLMFEKKRIIYKYIYNNLNLPYSIRIEALKRLQSLPLQSSPTRIRNRCVVTGRARSVYKHFKISRLIFRKLAVQGFLPGIKKANW